MSKLKILSVILENFKGFKKCEIKFDDFLAVVLAGKNGYGKTTIFDAIELVFTGRIARYVSYQQFHRGNTKMSQKKKPLAFDDSLDRIMVAVNLLLDDNVVTLYRMEKVNSIDTPLVFDGIFNELRIIYRKNDTDVDEAYLGQFELQDFLDNYVFLNYVSQEEATRFLKCKETERSAQISGLFNTAKIDGQLNKIEQVLGIVKEKKKSLANLKTLYANELKGLEKVDGKNQADYIRLVGEKEIAWDVVNPKLSNEDFNSLLGENGVLDSLLYLQSHQEEYFSWLRNKKIDSLLQSPLLPDYPYYLLWFLSQREFKLYGVFKNKLLPAIKAISLDNLSDNISPILQADFCGMVSDEQLEKIKSLFEIIVPLGQSASKLKKAWVELLKERLELEKLFLENNDHLKLVKCPLCGQEYESASILQEKVKTYEHVLAESCPDLQDGLGKLVKDLQVALDEVVTSLRGRFEKWNITDETYDKFCTIDFVKYEVFMRDVVNFKTVELSVDKAFGEVLEEVVNGLKKAKHNIADDLDYDLLHKIYTTIGKYIRHDDFTMQNIEKKRTYLEILWNNMKSKTYQEKELQLEKIKKKLACCEQKQDDLLELKKVLVSHKNKYLNKVISDIEILFYVYSGRIMQECYYGRGLFVKNDTSRKRILFVSEFESDVDALYNLSSGQLVSIVFAFVMALNKLYSSQKFLAIDDPVQTIDDINVWGFIETIRHSFYDSNILLSTHEDDYAALLRYKFSKIGIPAKCIDLSEVRNLFRE